MATTINPVSYQAQNASAKAQMDFQERMSNTAHQREVADLKKAGLNPVLSANGAGATTPAGAEGYVGEQNAKLFDLLNTTMTQNAKAISSISKAVSRSSRGSSVKDVKDFVNALRPHIGLQNASDDLSGSLGLAHVLEAEADSARGISYFNKSGQKALADAIRTIIPTSRRYSNPVTNAVINAVASGVENAHYVSDSRKYIASGSANNSASRAAAYKARTGNSSTVPSFVKKIASAVSSAYKKSLITR